MNRSFKVSLEGQHAMCAAGRASIVRRYETAAFMRRCKSNPLTNEQLDLMVELYPGRWADIADSIRAIPIGSGEK